MSHRPPPLVRNEYCVVCRTTTYWKLHEAMYVCSGGGSRRGGDYDPRGCGRKVPANDFHVRHNSGVGQP